MRLPWFRKGRDLQIYFTLDPTLLQKKSQKTKTSTTDTTPAKDNLADMDNKDENGADTAAVTDKPEDSNIIKDDANEVAMEDLEAKGGEYTNIGSKIIDHAGLVVCSEAEQNVCLCQF